MSRISLFVVAFLLVAGITASATSAAEVSCGVKYTSSYTLNIGLRATASDEGAIQGSCTVSGASGLYGGVWASQSTDDPGDDGPFSNEVDFYGGVVVTKGKVKMDLGVQYFDLVNPGLFDGKGDFFNPYVNLTFLTEGKVQPYLNLNGLVGTDEESFPGGWYVTGGAVYDFNVRDRPLAFGASLTHNEGAAGFTATTPKGRGPPPLRFGEAKAVGPVSLRANRPFFVFKETKQQRNNGTKELFCLLAPCFFVAFCGNPQTFHSLGTNA